jgi:hypothetical protein
MNGKRKYKHRETEEPNKEREIFSIKDSSSAHTIHLFC